MTIVIVCVAGVSGTFLSLRLRRAGIGIPVRVTGLSALADETPSLGDLVLVAPQIAVSIERVRALSGGATVVELRPADLAPGASDALAALIRSHLPAEIEGETA